MLTIDQTRANFKVQMKGIILSTKVDSFPPWKIGIPFHHSLTHAFLSLSVFPQGKIDVTNI